MRFPELGAPRAEGFIGSSDPAARRYAIAFGRRKCPDQPSLLARAEDVNSSWPRGVPLPTQERPACPHSFGTRGGGPARTLLIGTCGGAETPLRSRPWTVRKLHNN
jgi:hypothetical protein